MDLQTISFLFGATLLAVAILGGGFEIKEIRVPRVQGIMRLVSAVAGTLFIVIAIKDTLPNLNDFWRKSSLESSQGSDPQKPSDDNGSLGNPQSATWFVQFGYFSIKTNAEKELQELKDKGIEGLRIVSGKEFPGLSDLTGSYIVVGPMTVPEAEEFVKANGSKAANARIRNAYIK